MATPYVPRLSLLDPSALPTFTPPSKRIQETTDVSRFLTSLAYRDVGTFIMQLNHSVCPRNTPGSQFPTRFPLSSKLQPSGPVKAVQLLLASIEAIISEAPPAPGPQRFGNISFRTWHSLLEERVDNLLKDGLLGQTLQIGNGTATAEVQSYLMGSFGSSQRLDYGTGHELSFIAFLGCLWKLGHFKDDDKPVHEMEREIVLQIVEPYLVLVRKLITIYNLEPAGSHGVWGLDDHAFVPYIFGSAQFTRPINDNDAMPLEGSVRGAPKPADITKPVIVEDERQTNMYFSAVGFINDLKKGPFWEHSPMLFDISGVKDGWGKINKGMIKMYNAEVLSKFPVVQHFLFGSLFSWDTDPSAATALPVPSAAASSAAAAPPTMPPPPPSSSGTTTAPWLQSSRVPPPPSGNPGTAAPWAAQTRLPNSGEATANLRTSNTGTSDNVPTKAPWAR